MGFMFYVCQLPGCCAIRRTWQILFLAAGLTTTTAWAQYSPCDLNQDGKIDKTDWELAIAMHENPQSCTANIMGPKVCDFFVVQRVAYAGQPGGSCITGTGHMVSLTWVASTSTGVIGYNVYQGSAAGGPYILLNPTPVSAITYDDSTVQASQTYYYVVKAVGSDGSLSTASNETSAIVPTS